MAAYTIETVKMDERVLSALGREWGMFHGGHKPLTEEENARITVREKTDDGWNIISVWVDGKNIYNQLVNDEHPEGLDCEMKESDIKDFFGDLYPF